MTNLADAARQINAAQKLVEEHERINEAQRVLEAQNKLIEDSKVWAQEQVEVCRAAILKTASEGRSTLYHSIAMWEDDVSERTTQRAYALKTLLESEGLKVKVDYDRNDPVGSDPMFYTTVYSTNLIINW